ncbi:hypothetical protein ACQPW3_10715 [Actinosynnema sp. CA-248983]
MALLIGELYARVTSDSSAYRRDMDKVDAKGEASAKLAEKHARQIANAHKTTGQQVEDVDRKAGKYAATLLSMGAAGGAAGALITGGLVAVPVVLAAIGAAALATRDDVSEAGSALASEAREAMRSIAEPLADEVVKATGQVATGLRMIRPELRGMAEDGGPAVTMLVDGVIKLSTHAMPGMRKAVREGSTEMAGLNAMLERTGDGLSDFFEEIVKGAPAASRGMGDTGRVVEDLLGSVGRLAAQLANSGAGPWHQFVGVVDQTTDAALDLSEDALPAVASSASTVLGVLERILAVAGPLAPHLGTIAGILLSYRAGAAILGTVGDGFGRLGNRVEENAKGTGRAAGAARSLGSAMSGAGAAGAILGGALLATSAAADHFYGSSDALTQGLMSGGNAAAEARKQLKENDAVLASLGARTDLVSVVQRLFVTGTRDASEAVSEQRASMTSLQRAQVDAKAAAAEYSRVVEAEGEYSNAAAGASAALVRAQSDLKRAQYEAAQATKTLNDKLIEHQAIALGLASDNLRLRMATTAYEESQHRLNEVLKDGTATELEVRSAQEQREMAALRVIEATRLASLAGVENKESAEAQAAATRDANAAALNLAADSEGPVAKALATFIANLDDASLAAIGATREVDGTKQTIKTLEGKTVTIDAQDLATSKILEIQRHIDSLPESTTLDVHVKQLLSTSYLPDFAPANLGDPTEVLRNGTGMPRRASGGPVLRGHAYQINENGQEFFVPGMDGTIIDARKTSMLLNALNGLDGADLSLGDKPNKSVTFNITMHSTRALPTAQELRDVLHDVEVMYGDRF